MMYPTAGISIHALLAESDKNINGWPNHIKRFLSTLSLRRATISVLLTVPSHPLFLSTLSLRRATGLGVGLYLVTEISIHALLAESDRLWTILYSCPGNFYPRSPCGERLQRNQHQKKRKGISIHALLAESDLIGKEREEKLQTFLSTLSLRRATVAPVLAVGRAGYFYPRSPCGERLCIIELIERRLVFLSTLSLRRATSRLDAEY